MHGPAGFGVLNRKQLDDGVAETFINSTAYTSRPCLVLVPQLRAGKHWTSAIGDELMAHAKGLLESHPIDEKRIYLCGHAHGGVGAWHLLVKQGHEGNFLAAVVSSGGYTATDNSSNWRFGSDVPVWMFHGDADSFLPVDGARELVDVAKRRGGNVTYTEYPGEGNDIASKVFSTPAVHDWLFRQVRR